MIKQLKFFSSFKGASFNKELNAIHKECKAPFIAHLTIKYPTLSILDAEEIYDDAILALYQNVKEGKLKELTCSLQTYINRIGEHKAIDLLRQKQLDTEEFPEYETFLAAKVYGILLKCNFLGRKSVRPITFSRFFMV